MKSPFSVPIRAESVPVLGWLSTGFGVVVVVVRAGVEAVMEGRAAGEAGVGQGRASILFSGAGRRTTLRPLFRGGLHRGGAS